ncbi:MAG: hypothetical protein PVJ76_05540 [Gemmatimonadota bacterium]|jgi:hypothetical protein
MSQILRVKFGRSDRTYRYGERVTGWVMIQTSRSAYCKSIRIRRFWRTHGKGNEDKGDVAGMTLHRGPLPDDGPHIFEFDFPAPAGPFTYRGRYLNVDQYVEAKVDLPYARDPTVREEYVLLPGKPLVPPPPLLEMPRNPMKEVVPLLWGFVGAAVAMVGLALLLTASPVGFGFLLVGGILFLPVLKRRADERLGKSASARLSSLVAGPGEEVGVAVKVVPPKPVRLNRAYVELRAREVCVSGSGSNRRTHRHTVFSGGTPLSGATTLEGGAEKVFTGTIQIPGGAPCSFKGTANKLLWEAKVRLDIPSWPDWVKEIPLVVWPSDDQLGAGADVDVLPPWEDHEPAEDPGGPFLEPVPPAEPGPPSEPEPADEPEFDGLPDTASEPEPDLAATMSDQGEPEGEPDLFTRDPEETVQEPIGVESNLPALAAAIDEAGIFGKERDLLIKDLVGRPFDFSMEVRRVDRSIGIYTEADYRDGQTVTGVLVGSELEVVVYFPSDRNEEIKDWKPGSVHGVQAEVTDWDRLRKRPELLARG